jgi:O-acetyl-ADP-ribose deacetylase (regulator of RNase III)
MKIIVGNIFSSNSQTIVNTINTDGVMGAGIALEFKLRYPKMFDRYVELCEERKIDIGLLWIYKHSSDRWILNFPTKRSWKYPTKLEYLEKGLKKFLDTYEYKNIKSIAFPILGASKGGLSEDTSLSIMEKYLKNCRIPVEIYKYDPNAYDDLYLKFKELFFKLDVESISQRSKIRKNYVNKIREALKNPEIRSISRLATVKGIGLVSLEKSFRFVMDNIDKP